MNKLCSQDALEHHKTPKYTGPLHSHMPQLGQLRLKGPYAITNAVSPRFPGAIFGDCPRLSSSSRDRLLLASANLTEKRFASSP